MSGLPSGHPGGSFFLHLLPVESYDTTVIPSEWKDMMGLKYHMGRMMQEGQNFNDVPAKHYSAHLLRHARRFLGRLP